MHDERVTIRSGYWPVLITAPHGPNDVNSGLLALEIANKLDAFAVINNGWERGSSVDYMNDIANCNNVAHLHEDVVKEEFLDPILRYAKKIERDFGYCFVFHIHGVGNHVRATEPTLDIILGYGAGNPPSYSCDPQMKDAFIHYLKKADIDCYEGRADGDYAGRAKNNLNQLFRRWYPKVNVHSMQLEVVYELREDADMCKLTSEGIVTAIEDMMLYDDTVEISYRAKKF